MGTQFYTAQEEFLRSIDPILLIEQIRKFRMLDFKDLSKGEISNAIYEALSWNGKIIYLGNIGAYPANTSFFRVRKFSSKIDLVERFKSYSDFWEPPIDCVTTQDRLNAVGESMLYTSPEDPIVPIKEMRIEKGQLYALIKYDAKEIIRVNQIGRVVDYAELGISSKTAILNHEIVNSFLRDEFSRDVGQGTEYLYRISETIAKDYFDSPSEMQDAWSYASVQDKFKYNVCFRPEVAHRLLRLQGALICKKEDGDDIKVYCIALCSKDEDGVRFYPLGSEEQKRVFPNISY